MSEKISQQESEINSALLASEHGEIDEVKNLNIRDQHDAFYSIYHRGDESVMEKYNEMLSTKVSLHSQACEDHIRDAKDNAKYINPFKSFSDELGEGNFGKAGAALLLGPLATPFAAGATIYSGVQALREKIQLNKTRTALGLSTAHLDSLESQS